MLAGGTLPLDNRGGRFTPSVVDLLAGLQQRRKPLFDAGLGSALAALRRLCPDLGKDARAAGIDGGVDVCRGICGLLCAGAGFRRLGRRGRGRRRR
jgi:hypothetical protein